MAAAGVLAWGVIPLLASREIVDLLVFTALYSIAGIGVTFLLGQCGIISLAENVFYGIGAYATAYVTTALGLHWVVALVIGMAGGLLPALRAARAPVTVGLREL